MLPPQLNATTTATTECRIYCPLMPQSNTNDHLRPLPPSNADARCHHPPCRWCQLPSSHRITRHCWCQLPSLPWHRLSVVHSRSHRMLSSPLKAPPTAAIASSLHYPPPPLPPPPPPPPQPVLLTALLSCNDKERGSSTTTTSVPMAAPS